MKIEIMGFEKPSLKNLKINDSSIEKYAEEASRASLFKC